MTDDQLEEAPWGVLINHADGSALRAATREEWERSACSTGFGCWDDGARVMRVVGGPQLSVYSIVTQVWSEPEQEWADHSEHRVIHETDRVDEVARRAAGEAATSMASWHPGGYWRILVFAGDVLGLDELPPADACWVSTSAVTLADVKRIVSEVPRDHEFAHWAVGEYMDTVSRYLEEERVANLRAAQMEAYSDSVRVAKETAAQPRVDKATSDR